MMKRNSLVQFGLLLFCVVALMPHGSDAHGYVKSPPSRAYFCQLNNLERCGPVRYEPQSVEGPKGFPAAGPANGQIMGAGRYEQLNPQTPQWPTNRMSTGPATFEWYLTAPHRTSTWRYFITKNNWASTTPLTRADLDLTPFCEINGGGAVPPSTVQHRCNIPTDRRGYHIILAVWDIADTGNAFYQGIDVNFG